MKFKWNSINYRNLIQVTISIKHLKEIIQELLDIIQFFVNDDISEANKKIVGFKLKYKETLETLND